MNNDAFRALINKQRTSTSGEKSTKEIAREAVENEFQKKRRRGGGGGGGGRRGRGFNTGRGSDSGGSSDEDRGGNEDKDAASNKQEHQKNNDDEPDWKRRRREKSGSGAGGALEYRDRAKERREGNNIDYASLEGLAAQSGEDDRRRQAELSKYLGGDEKHTHLVKGLDKALAEKVRRDVRLDSGNNKSEDETGDLDQLLEDAYTRKKRQQSSQAREWERGWRSAKPRTELGKSVLSYLLQKEQTSASSAVASTATAPIVCNPSVQRSIQLSVLAFSLDSDVRKRKTAWEVPRISLKAVATHNADGGTAGRNMNPLSHHIIAAITKKLDGRASRIEKGKYQSSSAKKKGEVINIIVASKEDADGKDEQSGRHKEDDSDDEIFANVGSYVPQALSTPNTNDSSAATATASTEANGNGENCRSDNHFVKEDDVPKQVKTGSIFENLVQIDSPAKTEIQRHRQRSTRLQPSQENRNVIDRDILGGQETDSSQLPYQIRRGPQSSMIEGVSMTTYEGGYGEEMDVDFGNDDDEWQTLREEKEKGGISPVDAKDG
jgi:IK cytokine